MLSQEQKNKLVDFGGYISICAYLLAAIIKIGFGILYNSNSLYTDGLNSTSDVLSTIIIMVGLFLSRKPEDAEHKYGHHRIEQIATLFASFVMLLIGIQSLINAIQKVFAPNLEAPNITAAVIALISILIILISSLINRYIAKKTKIQAASVIAKHNVSDTITAIGALIAIIASQWNMPLIDPIVSVLIAGVILYTAFDIFKSSTNSLIDGFDTKTLTQYNKLVTGIPGVEKIIDIKGRMLGNIEILDVTIGVDAELTVGKAHVIADNIELALKQNFNIPHTHVHIEPYFISKIDDSVNK